MAPSRQVRSLSVGHHAGRSGAALDPDRRPLFRLRRRLRQQLHRRAFELSRVLSTPFHKYDHVCGEGFSAQTRRERRAYPFPTRRDKARATTSGPKRTAARRVASLFGSGVVAPRSSRQVGTWDAPSSRLARTEKRRNKGGRIYEMEYLAGGALQRQRTDPTG